jgi:hypothetical protein
MELLECLARIATKLEISANEILTLHCWNRGMLGKVGMRSAMAILANLAERYDFDDAPDAPTYGTQLVKKGILTPAEGYLFAEGYLLNAEKAKEHAASDGADAEAAAFDGKA